MQGIRIVLLGGLLACSGKPVNVPSQPVINADNAVEAPTISLKTPQDFAGIADKAARSVALFAEVSRVLLHPRCVNCHPQDDSPRQRDQHEMHNPPVVRGPNNMGVVAMRCQTCHQDSNTELARVPGARGWQLAPVNMAWLGKNAADICVQISDPKRNGGRTLVQVQEHLAHDPLVAWGWAPGADREPVPGTQAQLAALFQAWIDSGAFCDTTQEKKR
jgi:hypothetical protein